MVAERARRWRWRWQIEQQRYMATKKKITTTTMPKTNKKEEEEEKISKSRHFKHIRYEKVSLGECMCLYDQCQMQTRYHFTNFSAPFSTVEFVFTLRSMGMSFKAFCFCAKISHNWHLLENILNWMSQNSRTTRRAKKWIWESVRLLRIKKQ